MQAGNTGRIALTGSAAKRCSVANYRIGAMMRALCLFLAATSLQAQPKSVLLEDYTWTELRDAIAAGKTTAIYYSGSIEQNGPGMALGKHVFIARYVAQRIAEKL